ncbi:class I SAM-dependent methyltransferase [Chengkuizengella axinellae]|uniref:Class I SAM-dependent methyltransferase n=1 Tax=Chengkuizengella axinellae TaxID=3064388 RepID=A0ABT9IU35_9BACL|nr:class I SAM-dependent methyltransferase [Chengkuizengella sp. 2205SS18-9]MDP5272875.1 class I SAM-dependent methyltransferase [Chengkuizengella sp. 2205SS18-9]
MTNNKVLFPDPSKHPEWIPAHSPEWYARLNQNEEIYKYPWKSQFDEPTAEMIFASVISDYLNETSKILDVGCGHGEFTHQFIPRVKEVVGIDIQPKFINTANELYKDKGIQFQLVDANDKLPFHEGDFDLIYTKKGPWLYEEASRILKPNGIVLGLFHSGTDGGLRDLFPGLYAPLQLNPYDIEKFEHKYNLKNSDGLSDFKIEVIEEVEYLFTPDDVLIKKCFGQNDSVKRYVWQQCLKGVEKKIENNASKKGLKVINYHHIVSARVR